MTGSLLLVALGGAFGAMARFGVGLVAPMPLGTFAVNVLGSFVMGVLFVMLAAKGLERWAPLLLTGILGGFTTFSAFSLDALRLIEADRWSAALAYVAGSVLLSLAAVVAGVALARGVWT